MLYRIGAKESVGYFATWTLPEKVGDLTGWDFKMTFARQLGADDFTLTTSLDPEVQGFFIHDATLRQLKVSILPATLQGIPDTTGSFELMGDLLATPLGATRFTVADFILTVIKGPTA